VAAGFLAPLFLLGLSGGAGVQGGFITPLPSFPGGGSATVQAGFITPLPSFPGGGNAAIQAGFRTVVPVWPAGAGLPVEPVVARSKGGHGQAFDLRARLLREDEEILAVIMAYMESRD